MKNPLRDMSRPKALGMAALVAGAVALSGAAAALNVGLLTGNDSAPFTPQKVSTIADGSVTTTSTTEPPVEIVYQDVYEHAPASPASPATAAPVVPAAPAPAAAGSAGADDDRDDAYEDDSAYEDHEDADDEDEDHEEEDHEEEDHEEEDDGFDD